MFDNVDMAALLRVQPGQSITQIAGIADELCSITSLLRYPRVIVMAERSGEKVERNLVNRNWTAKLLLPLSSCIQYLHPYPDTLMLTYCSDKTGVSTNLFRCQSSSLLQICSGWLGYNLQGFGFASCRSLRSVLVSSTVHQPTYFAANLHIWTLPRPLAYLGYSL